MDQERHAVVIPGGLGGPYVPTLMFAADAALARGATIHNFWWNHSPGQIIDLPAEERGPWAVAQVEAVLADLAQPLLIARSFGTQCAVLAAEHGLAAVWLNPPLRWPFVVDGLKRATAPCLIVGATADRSWDAALARELSPHVFEVEGADHGLYVPGPLANSTAVLGEMVTAVERFLDEVVWPE